jgi:D-3-phosphoglycerate dehydrogenase
MPTPPDTFRVGVTRDFLKPDGSCGFGDIGLDLLRIPGLEWEYFDSPHGQVPASAVHRFDAMLVLSPRLTSESMAADSLSDGPRLRIVARFGVGYDTIDVAACTRHGILLTITPEGVRRPMAVAALTLLLALTHKLRIKDQLTRDGRWSEKLDYIGQGVTGRTLGIIGFGNIGRELARIVRPLDMKMMAFDPAFSAEAAANLHVERASLEELLRASDYVVIACELTPQTRHLIGKTQLALLRPNAYLINVARGPIVDQAALTECLERGKIAGAGLDVFESEPIAHDDPLLELDNVIVAPHAICWTDECFRLNGHSAIQSILEVFHGRCPQNIVNPAALDHPRWSMGGSSKCL